MGLEACALHPRSGSETAFMPELPDRDSRGGRCLLRTAVSEEPYPWSGAPSHAVALGPCLAHGLSSPCWWGDCLRMEVTTKQYAGGSYPLPELGRMGRLSGARCPQVSTGHRAPGHKGQLPTAGLWEPECKGRAHRPRLPSRPAHGGPHGTPFPSCEQWPPLTWRESPQALSPLQAGPGHPTAPLSQAYLDCAQRRRTRGRTNLLRTECPGNSGQPGSRANRLGMAGSPSTTWPQGRAGESLQVQRYGHHQGASRRNTSAGLSQITGLCPALPTRPPRPVLAALHLCVSSSTSPAGTTHSHRASVINLPVQASLRAWTWAVSLSTHKPQLCGSRAPDDAL